MAQVQLTEGVSVVSLHNIPSDGRILSVLLKRLGESGVNLDMISQSTPISSAISVSFTILDCDLVNTLKVLNDDEFEKKLRPLVSSENSKILLFDPEMNKKCGVAAAVIDALTSRGIEILMITTSELEISIAVPRIRQLDAVEAVNALIK